MKVRIAEIDDIEELVEMFQNFFSPSSAARVMAYDIRYIADRFAEWIEREDSLVLYTGRGFMVSFIHQSFYADEKIASELMWWVDPFHKGTGEGKAMKEMHEEWAKEKGAVVSTLGVGSAFATAAKTHEYLIRDGYTTCETVHMKRI